MYVNTSLTNYTGLRHQLFYFPVILILTAISPAPDFSELVYSWRSLYYGKGGKLRGIEMNVSFYRCNRRVTAPALTNRSIVNLYQLLRKYNIRTFNKVVPRYPSVYRQFKITLHNVQSIKRNNILILYTITDVIRDLFQVKSGLCPPS